MYGHPKHVSEWAGHLQQQDELRVRIRRRWLFAGMLFWILAGFIAHGFFLHASPTAPPAQGASPCPTQ